MHGCPLSSIILSYHPNKNVDQTRPSKQLKYQEFEFHLVLFEKLQGRSEGQRNKRRNT
jgi:hypothetical protein